MNCQENDEQCIFITFWCVSQCVANLTTAKFPLPIVRSRKYFPIFIWRTDVNDVDCWCWEDWDLRLIWDDDESFPSWNSLETIVDVREWETDDDEEEGEVEWTVVTGKTAAGSLNIWNKWKEQERKTRYSD